MAQVRGSGASRNPTRQGRRGAAGEAPKRFFSPFTFFLKDHVGGGNQTSGSPCGGSGACEAGGPRPNCLSSSGTHPLEPRVDGARLARAVRDTRAGVGRLWAGGAPVGRALLRAAFPELREAPGPGLVAWLWDQKHPASEWGGRGFGGLSRTLVRGAPLFLTSLGSLAEVAGTPPSASH